MEQITRTRWAAIGAAVAVSLGAGGIGLGQAAIGTGDKPVYVALDAPCRLVDTRPASVIGPKNTPIAAGDAAAYEIQVTGDSGQCTGALAVPADASAVALNVTAIAPVATATGRSFFTVYPADASRPGTSNLNFLNGAPPTPNKVDVGLSGDGKIKIYNNEGTAHAAVDIFGYYIDHHHDDRYYTEAESDAALATKAGRTETVIVPASAFRAVNPTIDAVGGNIYGAYVTGGAGTPSMRAPLALPVGSTISSVTYHYIDNSTESLSLDLVATSLGTASQGFVGIFGHDTSGADPAVRSVTIADLDYVIPPNLELAFGAFNGSWATEGNDLAVKGVVVEYTLP